MATGYSHLSISQDQFMGGKQGTEFVGLEIVIIGRSKLFEKKTTKA